MSANVIFLAKSANAKSKIKNASKMQAKETFLKFDFETFCRTEY